MVGFYRRFVRILRRFLPFIVAYLRDRQRFLLFGPPRQISEETHRERATRLRETMLSLGPTFVKVGQVLSVRPDLVPKVYREELSQLQDTVPEETTGDPREVLEEAFEGDPFEDIREVAGRSLAFVYRANYEGNDVAIKVRRPGLEPLSRSATAISFSSTRSHPKCLPPNGGSDPGRHPPNGRSGLDSRQPDDRTRSFQEVTSGNHI